jgi:1-acyl-sn-glycerol-3-phosphate acyltransferase
MNYLGMIFLKRSWDKDKKNIEDQFRFLIDNKIPTYFGVMPEGTRITEKKHQEAIQYALENQNTIPKPMNQVLLPRVKGFYAIMNHLKHSHIEYLYDITIGYSDGIIRVRDIFTKSFRGHKVLLNIKRIKIDSIPIHNENELMKWLLDRFYRKDELIAGMTSHFPHEQIHKSSSY